MNRNDTSQHATRAAERPSFDQYEALLTKFVPLNEPHDLRFLRHRLLSARDNATRVISNSYAHSDTSLAIHRIVLCVATENCFSLVGAENLRQAAEVCAKLSIINSTLAKMGRLP
jgi:hypothetical protein